MSFEDRLLRDSLLEAARAKCTGSRAKDVEYLPISQSAPKGHAALESVSAQHTLTHETTDRSSDISSVRLNWLRGIKER